MVPESYLVPESRSPHKKKKKHETEHNIWQPRSWGKNLCGGDLFTCRIQAVCGGSVYHGVKPRLQCKRKKKCFKALIHKRSRCQKSKIETEPRPQIYFRNIVKILALDFFPAFAFYQLSFRIRSCILGSLFASLPFNFIGFSFLFVSPLCITGVFLKWVN
jgi:hypothetical protein